MGASGTQSLNDSRYHSDRDSQYASDAYLVLPHKARLRCAMTDGYDGYQNALAERVNGLLKDKFLFVLPDDLAQARLLVDQAVHRHNEEHPHLLSLQSSPSASQKPCRKI